MRIESLLIILALISIPLLSGCVETESETDAEKATLACMNECRIWLNADKELSKGPCLLNPITDIPDWVCDIAHSPRQDVDNDPNNQCSAFREGRAHHFVEVDENCELIRAV